MALTLCLQWRGECSAVTCIIPHAVVEVQMEACTLLRCRNSSEAIDTCCTSQQQMDISGMTI